MYAATHTVIHTHAHITGNTNNFKRLGLCWCPHMLLAGRVKNSCSKGHKPDFIFSLETCLPHKPPLRSQEFMQGTHTLKPVGGQGKERMGKLAIIGSY